MRLQAPAALLTAVLGTAVAVVWMPRQALAGEPPDSEGASAPASEPIDPLVRSPLAPAPSIAPAGSVPRLTPQQLDADGPARAHFAKRHGAYDPLLASRSEHRARSEPTVLAVLASIVSSGAGLAVVGTIGRGGTRSSAWYSFIALEGWAIGTGAIVCAVGQTSPSRHGGCWTSIAGALIGAVAIVPGWLMVRSARQPCTIQGPNADDRCATGAGLDVLLGYSLASLGYAAGASTGSVVGWRLGASQRDPRLASQSVSIQALSVHF